MNINRILSAVSSWKLESMVKPYQLYFTGTLQHPRGDSAGDKLQSQFSSFSCKNSSNHLFVVVVRGCHCHCFLLSKVEVKPKRDENSLPIVSSNADDLLAKVTKLRCCRHLTIVPDNLPRTSYCNATSLKSKVKQQAAGYQHQQPT